MTAANRGHPRRAVLLFTRPPLVEARLKRLSHLAGLFAQVRDRALAAATARDDADLIIVGHAGSVRLPAGARRLPQRGQGLGERFVRALEDVRALGYDQIVAIGSDSPSLEAANVHQAFETLDAGSALVLGPAADGGVYLLGLSGAVPASLREVPWGTRRVFDSLLAQLEPAAVLAQRLDDVDGPRGLWRLRRAGALPASLARELLRLMRPVAWPRRARTTLLRPTLTEILRVVSWRGPPTLPRPDWSGLFR